MPPQNNLGQTPQVPPQTPPTPIPVVPTPATIPNPPIPQAPIQPAAIPVVPTIKVVTPPPPFIPVKAPTPIPTAPTPIAPAPVQPVQAMHPQMPVQPMTVVGNMQMPVSPTPVAPTPASPVMPTAPRPMTMPVSPMMRMPTAPVMAQKPITLTPEMFAQVPQLQHKKSHLLLIVILILLMLGGGSVFAYPYYAQYLPAPIKNFINGSEDPQVVLMKMLQTMTTVRAGNISGSVTYSTEIPAEYQQVLSGSVGTSTQTALPVKASLTVKSNSTFDLSDAKNPQSKNALQISGNYGANTTFAAAVDTLINNKSIFFRFSNLNLPIPVDLSFITNKWISVMSSSTASNSVNALSEKYAAISVEDQAKIKDILENANIIQVKNVLGEETIDGAPSYHYSLGLDKNALGTAMFQIAQIVDKKNTVTATDKANFQKTLDSIDLSSFDIWIGKSDYIARKISSAGSWTLPTPQQDQAKKIPDIKIAYSTDGTFAPLTSPLVIDVPPDAVPLETMLQTFMQKFFPAPTPPPAKTVTKK